MPQITLKWELFIGLVVQLLGLTILGAGLWFGLVGDVDQNRRDIQVNKDSIAKIQENNLRMMESVNRSADRREERLMGHIIELKDNLAWLVRREADKGGAD